VSAPRILVLDACVAVTFGNIARLDLITGIRGYQVAIGARARAEVSRDPARAEVQSAVSSGALSVAAIDLAVPAEVAALADFDRRPAFRGRGEAEVLALARTRGYAVASDERAVLTAARAEAAAGPSFSSLEFLVFAVRESRLDLASANALLGKLDIGRQIVRYLQTRRLSLQDLV
jgi:hypothetical protein